MRQRAGGLGCIKLGFIFRWGLKQRIDDGTLLFEGDDIKCGFANQTLDSGKMRDSELRSYHVQPPTFRRR